MESIEIMIFFSSDNTLKQYNSLLHLWWDFCQLRRFPVFGANVQQVLSFLQWTFYRYTHSCGSFNTHRAALFLILISSIQNDPLIKRFLQGILSTRPIYPRYISTWDRQTLLDCLDNLYRSLPLLHLATQ